MQSAPRRPHFLAGAVEVVTADECDRAVTDHFLRQVSQDGFRAWAHLNQNSLGVRHQDQVLRGLEDAAALLDLLAERPLGSLVFSDVAYGLGCADGLARWALDRRDAERNLDRAAILANPHRLMVVDRFTS